MTDTAPKVIRLTKANGDFYEGVSLNVSAGRIKLYVTASNIDSLSGTTEAGTIVDVHLDAWSVSPQGGVPEVSTGFTIIDDKGERRRALMDQQEYDSWRKGDRSTISNDLRIGPKRDFGSTGYYIAGIRTCIREGWTVVFTKGLYKGALALPGGVWASSHAEALRLINVYVAAGGNVNSDIENDPGFADRFHALSRLTKEA